MKQDLNNINLDEELDILDLDEEEIVYAEIDENVEEEEFLDEEFDEEFVMEEPYVVPVTEEMLAEEISEEKLIQYDETEEAFERADSEEITEEEKFGFWAGLTARLRSLDTMDKIIMTLGCVVLVMAIVALGVFTAYQNAENQMLTFADSGKNLEDIYLIGEHGLSSVTEATIEKIDALNAQKEEENNDGEEIETVVTSVVVKMNFTSIQKDLKIKFTNKKTGKLIAGIPFEVKAVAPSGKESIWTDDDKDGIIYNKNIAGGTYYLTLQELEGEIYEKYVLDTSMQTATVKKEIAYVQVDVSDEIKDESEIDVSKEDTELGNTVESALKDTVKWVASNSTSAGKDYVLVKKADIAPPAATTRAIFNNTGYMMMMISQEEPGPGLEEPEPTPTPVTITGLLESAEVKVGKTVSLSAKLSDQSPVVWTSSDPSIATVDNGTVTGVAQGSVTITASNADSSVTASCAVRVTEEVVTPDPVPEITVTVDKTTVEVEVGKTVSVTPTVNGTDNKAVTYTSSDSTIATVNENGVITGIKEGNVTITVASQQDAQKTASVSVTVKPAQVAASITLNKNKAEIEIGKSDTLSATTLPTEGVSVKWTSSDTSIATVTDGKVTGVKAGKVTIKAALFISGTEKASASCEVTVKAQDRKITLDNTKLNLVAGDEKTLKATVTGYTDLSKGKVTWATSDKTIATVDDKGKVVALKEGKVKITATNTENNVKVEAVCEVTIQAAQVLKTKAGEEVYVLKDNKYVKATAADYADDKAVFYVYKEVFKYQGWQTIDGKTYYYTEDNKKVTGEQVIMGAKYVFDSDGVLTSTTGIMGIDVSKWNGDIDWSQVKASGVNYVIIRCGYRGSSKGSLIEDPKYKANIEGATKAGLKVGVYFFSQAIDEVEAVQEASMVLSLVKNYKISYPIFLDVEASGGRADNISKETRTAVCKAFCQTIQNAGYTPGVYANRVWLNGKIDTSQLGNCKIWLAQYAAQPTYTGRYEIWQYKDSGSVPGIKGHVDLNLSYLGY